MYFNPSVAARWGLLKGGPQDGHGNGTMAEYISVREEIPFPLPEHLSFVEGSAIPLAGLTAWHALVLGEITPATAKGKRILVPGIGGGVAVFALQFAVAMGAEVWTTSGNDAKLAKAKELGAKGGVNYKAADWAAQLEKQLGGHLFDAVIDGTSGPHTKSYMRLSAEEGKIVVYGAVAGSESTITMPFMWFKSLQIRGAVLGSRQEYAAMDEFIRSTQMKPVISRVFDGLENAEAAFDDMRVSWNEAMRQGSVAYVSVGLQNYAQMGKLVIDIAGEAKGDSKL